MNIENPQKEEIDKPLSLHSNLDLNLFEFMSVTKEWKIDFLQLGEGVFKSNIDQVIFPKFQLAHVIFSSRVKQEGCSPLGYWSFAFVEENDLYWRNYKVKGKAVIIYAPGSKINAVSSANFETTIFSIDENIFFSLFEKEDTEGLLNKLNTNVIIPTNEHLWNHLKDKISEGIECYNNITYENSKPYYLTTFTTSLIQLINTSTPLENPVSSMKRLDVLISAEHYIQKNITENVKVSEIAKHCNVSERTLLYAFKQRFSMGAKEYVKILKLNYVYFLLHKEMDGETITDKAQVFDFWHMGQFHTDYKKFFGELPSQTIQKSLD